MDTQLKWLIGIGIFIVVIILIVTGRGLHIFPMPTEQQYHGQCNSLNDSSCTKEKCINSDGIWNDKVECFVAPCPNICTCQGICKWDAIGCDCLED